MQISLYAEDQAHAWESLLTEAAHTVTPLRWGETVPAADVAVVVLDEPWPARVWLRTLAVPLILVTEAVEPGRQLCVTQPLLRVVCHPQRAIRDAAGAADQEPRAVRRHAGAGASGAGDGAAIAIVRRRHHAPALVREGVTRRRWWTSRRRRSWCCR